MYYLDEDILKKLGDINIFITNNINSSKEDKGIIVKIKEKKVFRIAIDGPSASGKSTISKYLSEILAIDYLDTGAMYRAITFYLLENGYSLTDENEIEKGIKKIILKYDNNNIIINNKILKDELRTEVVTKNVSLISSYSSVRSKLVNIQREIAKKNSIILDGRDIGTVVLPNAEYKFFLVADPEVRARRRLKDKNSRLNMTFDEIVEDIKRRDYLDSTRAISPLKKAEDAIVIDSSKLTINEVVENILKSIRGI
ncbi:(d)CMP kinase [Miniphocaeibacter halophilus]|uniref:(D)CMP kinase n=2 Tax=Miniphocaeibacter halophilus TaxID=2931922 RepID=A0AC61N0L6_9FIRM|nr:(d)CMP kinase [Miniphocaeibacter halophilus]